MEKGKDAWLRKQTSNIHTSNDTMLFFRDSDCELLGSKGTDIFCWKKGSLLLENTASPNLHFGSYTTEKGRGSFLEYQCLSLTRVLDRKHSLLPFISPPLDVSTMIHVVFVFFKVCLSKCVSATFFILMDCRDKLTQIACKNPCTSFVVSS